MSKKEISYKASLAHHQAVGHLEKLVESLKQKSVCLQVGEEYVLLSLDEGLPMELEVNASEKKGKNRLTLELTWREVRLKDSYNESMIISSRAPSRREPPPATPEPAATAPPSEKAADKPKAAPKSKAKVAPQSKPKTPAKGKAKAAAKPKAKGKVKAAAAKSSAPRKAKSNKSK